MRRCFEHVSILECRGDCWTSVCALNPAHSCRAANSLPAAGALVSAAAGGVDAQVAAVAPPGSGPTMTPQQPSQVQAAHQQHQQHQQQHHLHAALLARAGSTASSSGWERFEHQANVPLLLPAQHRLAPPSDTSSSEDDDARDAGRMLSECKHILVIGGPLFIEGVAAIGQQLVATSCLGHVGNPAALSALILAQSLYAVTGYSLVSGLASALETLCGQAYGAGNLRMMSTALVRAQLVCALAIVPTLVLYGSGAMAKLLPALGQQQDIAAPASRLLTLLSPALLLSVVSETVAQYLLAQGKALPTMVSSLVGLLLAPVLYWGLVVGAGLGLTGAAVASAGIQASLVVQLLGYLLLSECWGRQRRSLTGWSGFSVLEALQGWAAYLRFGLPCVMMVCLEWWMWEVIVWLAGLLPSAEVAVAVTGISTQIQSLPWILCYSLGTATSTRVAQALGAGNARKAASLYRTSCVLVLLASGVMCAAMYLFRDIMAAAFTSSAEVQAQLKRVLPVVVTTIVLDGQAAVLSGVLRGAGRQGLGATCSWLSYWLVGLPLAWLLAFRARLGVLGLRTALGAAVLTQALVLHVYTATRMDFVTEAARAKERVNEEVDGDAAAGAENGAGAACDDSSSSGAAPAGQVVAGDGAAGLRQPLLARPPHDLAV